MAYYLIACKLDNSTDSEATGPTSPLLPLGLALRRGVAAFAVLRPIKRKSVSYKPVGEIRPTNSADRHRALVSVASRHRACPQVTAR